MYSIVRHFSKSGPARVSRAGARRLAMLALLGGASTAWAALDISTVPLFLGAKATPNVMYNIDESWSMAWRYMPDERKVGTQSIYGNPFATAAGDGGDGNGLRWGVSFHPGDYSTCATNQCNGTAGEVNAFVARAKSTGVANDLISARLRAPSFNTIYYNPEVRYYPWTNSDGTSFPDANSKAAWLNPNTRPAVGTATEQSAAVTARQAVNLEGELTFSTSTRWCRSSTSNSANETNTSNNAHDTNNNTAYCSNLTGEKLAPAVYYTYNGNGLNNAENFTRVRIMDSATFTRGAGRTDCTVVAGVATCTQAQEYQNFANWFTYNRSRMFLAIAATSRAFAGQSAGLRLGYARIHQDATTIDGWSSPGTVQRGVRMFDGTDRSDFFTWLYSLGGKLDTTNRQIYGASADHKFEGGTPLRQAMDDVGQYYNAAYSNTGPWSATPGTANNTAALTCRKSYHILMTDGMYTSETARTSAAKSNVDNNSGSQINGPAGAGVTPYTYSAVVPYKDAASNTLADVAMYYWNRDLQSTVANKVVPDDSDPAFWQHMVNFTVGLGVNGTLSYPGDWAALQAGTKNWPSSITANTAATVDDLWHAAVNSRGEYFSANDPQEFTEQLSSILTSVAIREESSSSTIAANSTKLDTGTLIFQARFNSRDWSGQLVAYDLNSDGSVDDEVWDTNDSGRIPAAASRNIFTASGTQGTTTTTGLNFTVVNWNSLTTSQRAQLNNAADTTANGAATYGGIARMNWLRGDKTKEVAGGFRTRTRILGDIVNSDPYFVGSTEDFGYRALPGTEGSSYAAFLSNTVANNGKSGRRNMIYVGANDGMLHGFDALTGNEIFGYVPLGVYHNLYKLTSTSYTHTFFVDGSPRAGDAYIANAWRTVLVGSTGAGGKSVFALNITAPDSMGAGKLMWEFSTGATATDKLGTAMSNPVIARVKSGNKWVAIFGNGYDSGDNQKLFVVDLETGALLKSITTGISGTNNGLATVIPVDVDNDRITDYVYAGDLLGNLWKFDLTSTSMASWTALKLFQATDGTNPQPITSRPVVGRHPTSGLMIYFGTGKYFESTDATIPTSPQIQSFYGIRDTNTLVTRANLLQQSIEYEGNATVVNDASTTTDDAAADYPVRVVSANGAGTVPTSGWFINLAPPPGTAGIGERVVSAPLLRSGRVIFTSIIPNSDPCGFGGTSWLMELDAVTGGRLGQSVLDVNNDASVDSRDYVLINNVKVPVSGKRVDEMIKTPGIVGAGVVEYKYTSGSSGTVGVTRESSGDSGHGRQSWRQLQ